MHTGPGVVWVEYSTSTPHATVLQTSLQLFNAHTAYIMSFNWRAQLTGIFVHYVHARFTATIVRHTIVVVTKYVQTARDALNQCAHCYISTGEVPHVRIMCPRAIILQ